MKIDPKRILIIEVNWLGDILFTTPAIRAIRENNPDAFIGCLCVPRCVEMLESNPDIDEVIIFDERSTHKSIFSKIKTIKELKAKRFDMVISFHGSMSRMLLAACSGIPRRIGYKSKQRCSWLLTDKVEPPKGQPHRVEYFLDITRSVSMDTSNKDYTFCVPQESVESAMDILKRAGIENGEEFFVINPGGNWLPKRWPAKLYAELSKVLGEKYKRKILITGAAKDKPLADEIIRISGDSTVGICGDTTLKELAAIMKRASVVIANDSGPMHIAVSQKAPTVALFGPTSPKITGPYGGSKYFVINKWYDCDIPCYRICDDYKCMETITVEDVMSAAGKILS